MSFSKSGYYTGLEKSVTSGFSNWATHSHLPNGQGSRQVVCQLNCKKSNLQLRLAQGKQHLRATCSKGKLVFKFFSSLVLHNCVLYPAVTGSRDGAVVRALASHQCSPGSITRLNIMWVEFVVGSRPCSEGFSPGSLVFLPPKKFPFDLEHTATFEQVPRELFGAQWVNKLHLHLHLKTGSLNNAIPEFWLAQRSWYISHYTMPKK